MILSKNNFLGWSRIIAATNSTTKYNEINDIPLTPLYESNI